MIRRYLSNCFARVTSSVSHLGSRVGCATANLLRPSSIKAPVFFYGVLSSLLTQVDGLSNASQQALANVPEKLWFKIGESIFKMVTTVDDGGCYVREAQKLLSEGLCNAELIANSTATLFSKIYECYIPGDGETPPIICYDIFHATNTPLNVQANDCLNKHLPCTDPEGFITFLIVLIASSSCVCGSALLWAGIKKCDAYLRSMRSSESDDNPEGAHYLRLQ